MTEQKTETMNRFFAERISECDRRGRELSADERGDEAVFEKVRANIYTFNEQSRRMFLEVGFKQTDEEWFEYDLAQS